MLYTKRFSNLATLGIAIVFSIFAFSCVSFELTEPAENLQWDINGMVFVQTIESNQGWTEDFYVTFEETSENKYIITAIQDTYYAGTHDQRIYILESISTSENEILCQKIELTYQTSVQGDDKEYSDFFNTSVDSFDFTGEATDIFSFDPGGDGSATWSSKGLTMDILLVAEEQREDKTARPPTDYGEPLFNAVAKGDLEEVKNLLKSGSDINMRHREYAGTTLLLTALFENQNEIAEFLIDSGADISIPRADGQTALMTAAYLGQAGLVEKLISAGADVNAVKEDGFTPLIIGAEGGNPEVGRLLLEAGADVNAINNSSWTALFRASYDGNIELIQILIGYGADINHTEPVEQLNALILAATQNSNAAVKLLVDAGAELNTVSKYGTALDIAKELGNSKMINILTQAGAR